HARRRDHPHDPAQHVRRARRSALPAYAVAHAARAARTFAFPHRGAQMSAELLTDRPAGSDTTLVLKLSNPGAKNALHPDMYAAGIEALNTAERDSSVRAIVLTGADNFFCAGGNLNRLLENRAKDPSVQADSIDLLGEWIAAFRSSTKPVIAAVEGAAAGAGFSL